MVIGRVFVIDPGLFLHGPRKDFCLFPSLSERMDTIVLLPGVVARCVGYVIAETEGDESSLREQGLFFFFPTICAGFSHL